MKKQRILKLVVKFGVLVFLIVSSGLALYIIYNGKDFDPVAEVQRLNSENRRDDALDVISVFHNNQPEELGNLNDELRYGALEKAKDFTISGMMLGQVHNVYSGLGALVSDLCVYGDLRDIADQSWKYHTKDENYDQMVLYLSIGGLGLSTLPAFDGIESLSKNILKYLRNAPTEVSSRITSLLKKVKQSPEYVTKLWDLLKKTRIPSPEPYQTYPMYQI